MYLIVSLFEIVPAFAFDTVYHFGALWNFLLPALLFVTPDRKNPKETLAVWIADSVFAQVSSVIESVVPDAFVVRVNGECEYRKMLTFRAPTRRQRFLLPVC